VGGDFMDPNRQLKRSIADKCSNVLYEDTAQSFFGLAGHFLYDPKVVYAPGAAVGFMAVHDTDFATYSTLLLP